MTPLQHLIQEREAAFEKELEKNGFLSRKKLVNIGVEMSPEKVLDFYRETVLLAYKAGVETTIETLKAEARCYNTSIQAEFMAKESSEILEALSAIEKSV